MKIKNYLHGRRKDNTDVWTKRRMVGHVWRCTCTGYTHVQRGRVWGGESNDDYAADDDDTGVMLGGSDSGVDEVFDPEDED